MIVGASPGVSPWQVQCCRVGGGELPWRHFYDLLSPIRAGGLFAHTALQRLLSPVVASVVWLAIRHGWPCGKVADVADDQYLTVACTQRQTTIAAYIYMHAKVGLLVMLRRSHAS